MVPVINISNSITFESGSLYLPLQYGRYRYDSDKPKYWSNKDSAFRVNGVFYNLRELASNQKLSASKNGTTMCYYTSSTSNQQVLALGVRKTSDCNR